MSLLSPSAVSGSFDVSPPSYPKRHESTEPKHKEREIAEGQQKGSSLPSWESFRTCYTHLLWSVNWNLSTSFPTSSRGLLPPTRSETPETDRSGREEPSSLQSGRTPDVVVDEDLSEESTFHGSLEGREGFGTTTSRVQLVGPHIPLCRSSSIRSCSTDRGSSPRTGPTTSEDSHGGISFQLEWEDPHWDLGLTARPNGTSSGNVHRRKTLPLRRGGEDTPPSQLDVGQTDTFLC